MTIQVKICGLNSRAAAEAALRAGADFGGLVFFEKSPRHVGFEAARALGDVLRGKVRIVTLLVDPADDAVDQAVAAVAPDFIQLHGNESPQRTAEIAARTKRPIIKAIPVAETADVAHAHFYADVAEFFLFDAKADIVETRPGGLGQAFDWKLISGASFARPWGLAGGLTPENIARAIAIAKPAFVDASTGVEDAPGRKSPEKIAAFVKAARNASYMDSTGL
jgi:phosphoribosylanthranilate isomerase